MAVCRDEAVHHALSKIQGAIGARDPINDLIYQIMNRSRDLILENQTKRLWVVEIGR
jgi:hypothetical protein